MFVASIAVSLFGDAALKRAGMGPSAHWFAAGLVAYAATSFGWFLLLRGRSLLSVGTLYPVANAIGLMVLGVLVFHERMGLREGLGLALGVASMVLLGSG